MSAWLAAEGFKVNSVNKARTVIEFSGSVGQVQDAFHTQIHNLEVNGEKHLANISDPQIPAALAAVVAGISSLHNFFPRAQHTQPFPGKYDPATGKLVPELTTGSASQGYFLWTVPGDAATIYDAPNSFNMNFKGSASYTGTGVTIGIVGVSNIDLSTIANYRNLFGLPAQAPTVVVDGNDPGMNGAADEAFLDLEISGGLAPGAAQIFYTAANTNLNSGLLLAIARALNDNSASIISVSFLECEASLGTGGNQILNSLWEQAAAQGISVTVSAGDAGSAGCDDFDTAQQAQYGLQVSGFASTPFNIAVGGTDYDVLKTQFAQYVSSSNSSNFTSVKSYIPEQPWNNSTSANGALSANVPLKYPSNGDTNIVAGSGGASSCILPQYDTHGNLTSCATAGNPVAGVTGWPKPAWQTGSGLNIPDDGVRDLPDVSLLAANGLYNATWLVCTDDVDHNGNSHNCGNNNGYFYFEGFGGTSASAPAFAGMLALVSQSQGGARLGQANYVLYNLANQASLYGSVFHDVTTGNNSVYCAPGSPDCGGNLFETGYDAGTAYDLASGLGSVDVTQLINNWSKAAFTPTTTAFTINGGTSPVSINHSDAITIAADVTGSGGIPSGQVAIVGNPNQQPNTYNSNAIGTLSLGQGGSTGSQSFTYLPGGTYTLSAYYGGDVTFAQSQSSGIQITVAKDNSTLNLFATDGQSNFTPSGSYPYGTYFSLDAQPTGSTPPASGATVVAKPTGTVIFSDSAGPLPGTGPGSNPGVAQLNSSGIAELPGYYWPTGQHAVSASYKGDNSYNSSVATPAAFTITPAPTTASLDIAVNPEGSPQTGIVTLALTITPDLLSQAAAPTGYFTVSTNGTAFSTDYIQSSTVSPTGGVLGVVTLIVPEGRFYPGNNNIVATYDGDSNYQGSSATGTFSSPLSPAIQVSVGSFPGPIVAGESGMAEGAVSPVAFNGVVNLNCSVTGPSSSSPLPTCSFNPNPVTIAKFLEADTTLSVSTTATTTPGSYSVAISAADAATGTITASFHTQFSVIVDDTFSIIATAATVSSPGQSGSSTISITPTNYTGTVKLSCTLTTSPAGANVAYNPVCSLPATASVSGSAATTVTASFNTTAATSGALAFPGTNRWYTAAGGAALACALLFGIPARRRGWRSMLCLIAVLAAAAAVGCGGGGGGNQNNGTPGTSTGTYTFTVTGTDSVTSAITANTTVNLTVN